MQGLDTAIIRHALYISHEPSREVIQEKLAELLRKAEGVFDSLLAQSDLVTVSFMPNEEGGPVDDGGPIYRDRMTQTVQGVTMTEEDVVLGTLHAVKGTAEVLEDEAWVASEDFSDIYSVVLKRNGEEDRTLFELSPEPINEFSADLLGDTHEGVRYSELDLMEQASTIMDRMAADIPA